MKPYLQINIPIIRSTKAATAILAVVLWTGLLPAQGQIFVDSDNGFAGDGSVGEYNLNGTAINTSLIPYGSLYLPNQMTASGSYLYIVNATGSGTIGKYTTSGATVSPSPLVSGLNNPYGVAVSGTDLFVAMDGNGGSSSGSVGAFNTVSGAAISLPTSIAGLYNPTGVAVSGNDLFVANYGNGAPGTGTIGEYMLNGTPVNASLFSGLGGPSAVAVSGSYLFVLFGSGTIGEYNVDGATVNASLVTGLNGPTAIAVSGSSLYVNERGGTDGMIIDYTLGGTAGTITSTNTIISGLYEDTGFAVESVPEPSTWMLLLGGLIALRCLTAKHKGAPHNRIFSF